MVHFVGSGKSGRSLEEGNEVIDVEAGRWIFLVI